MSLVTDGLGGGALVCGGLGPPGPLGESNVIELGPVTAMGMGAIAAQLRRERPLAAQAAGAGAALAGLVRVLPLAARSDGAGRCSAALSTLRGTPATWRRRWSGRVAARSGKSNWRDPVRW